MHGLLLLYSLLLLLDRLLLSLELILSGLKLCKCSSGLLGMASLSCLIRSSMTSRARSVYGAGGAELELPAS